MMQMGTGEKLTGLAGKDLRRNSNDWMPAGAYKRFVSSKL